MGRRTIFKASPIINTRSESVIYAGFFTRYPAMISRNTACAWMRVLDETRAIFAVGGAFGRLVMRKSWPWEIGLVRVFRVCQKACGEQELSPVENPHLDRIAGVAATDHTLLEESAWTNF